MPIGEVDGDPDRPERAVLIQKDHPICDRVSEVFDLLGEVGCAHLDNEYTFFGLFQIFNKEGQILMSVGIRDESGGPGRMLLPAGIAVDIRVLLIETPRILNPI